MSLLYSLLENNRLHFAPTDIANENELWLVTLSAISSSYIGDNVNTVLSGQENDIICYRLQRTWSVSDRDTFELQIQELAAAGYRSIYHPILLLLKKNNTPINHDSKMVRMLLRHLTPTQFLTHFINKSSYTSLAKRADIEQPSGINQLAKHLKRLENEFQSRGLGSISEIDSLVAWDAIYLINICRWAVQMEYIERNEFVIYANLLTIQVKMAYTCWEQASLAFILGELIQKYNEQRAKTLLDTTSRFLYDKFSPTKIVSFH